MPNPGLFGSGVVPLNRLTLINCEVEIWVSQSTETYFLLDVLPVWILHSLSIFHLKFILLTQNGRLLLHLELFKASLYQKKKKNYTMVLNMPLSFFVTSLSANIWKIIIVAQNGEEDFIFHILWYTINSLLQIHV